MAAEANLSRTPGSGQLGAGTEATTRRKIPNPPLSGPGDTSSPGPSKNLQGELALDAGQVSTGARPGSKEVGGTEGLCGRGGLPGGTEKPLSASALIQILTDDRKAMRSAKQSIEKIILKLHIEDRSELAIALCELNHALAGGVR